MGGRTARAGRVGKAVTLVIPTQVALLQAIEGETKVRMEELSIDEERVAEILLQVNTTLREVDIELGEQDWDEKKNINKRKKIILEGKDPEQVEKAKEEYLKEKRKRAKKERKKMIKAAEKSASASS